VRRPRDRAWVPACGVLCACGCVVLCCIVCVCVCECVCVFVCGACSPLMRAPGAACVVYTFVGSLPAVRDALDAYGGRYREAIHVRRRCARRGAALSLTRAQARFVDALAPLCDAFGKCVRGGSAAAHFCRALLSCVRVGLLVSVCRYVCRCLCLCLCLCMCACDGVCACVCVCMCMRMCMCMCMCLFLCLRAAARAPARHACAAAQVPRADRDGR
jgi:hypothetical protein